jgi:hypothetical protein
MNNSLMPTELCVAIVGKNTSNARLCSTLLENTLQHSLQTPYNNSMQTPAKLPAQKTNTLPRIFSESCSKTMTRNHPAESPSPASDSLTSFL